MAKAPPKTKVVIATRGSQLALWQANYVTGLLKARGVTGEQLVIKTTGDKVQDRFLHEIGGKGTFIKELEEALADGRADLAVHSLKDMTAKLEPRFALGAVLKRHEPADVLIFRDDVAAKVKPGALLAAKDLAAFGELVIGTGSLRRQALLARHAPKLKTLGVRGNVDTRLKKLKAGEWDALILAEASLERLGIKDVKACRLSPDWFVPCASQGALALETRSADPLTEWLKELACPETTAAVGIERQLLARLGGDCTMPFGCLVRRDPANPSHFVGRASLLSREGDAAEATHAAPYSPEFDAPAFADALALKLKQNGAKRILGALGIPVPKEFA